MVGRGVQVKGALRPHKAGRRVTIKRRTRGEWRRVARPRLKSGRYSANVSVAKPGRSRIKVVFGGDATNSTAVRTRKVVVYDPELASWYGPGLYGNRTACGQTLGYDTVGVAHRTLPCGTKVGILYRGRSITVPVIDRGPNGSAEWDLTRGAASRLRFSGHGTVGTVH
jgi:rare lipoprotein A (peptidoglycan hydrolase)